ncbi:MAG: hypothetical protein ACR2Q3_19645 [Woeseiaceae bacterium]
MTSSQNKQLSRQIHAVAQELSKLAIACNIALDQQDLWKRILQNDNSVCDRKNAEAFQHVRQHLMALFPMEERAIDDIGAQATEEVLDEVRAAIARLRLAGSPSASLPPKYRQ